RPRVPRFRPAGPQAPAGAPGRGVLENLRPSADDADARARGPRVLAERHVARSEGGEGPGLHAAAGHGREARPVHPLGGAAYLLVLHVAPALAAAYRECLVLYTATKASREPA